MALELGLHDYATGVVENWLKFYARRNGTSFYRYFGMQDLGRELTIFAQYYKYTGDPKGLLQTYFEKIEGRIGLLMERRRAAQTLPKDAQAFGMLTGNANEDLGTTEITCGTTYQSLEAMDHADCQTELPWISISAEVWRGFHEAGPVFSELGRKLGRGDMAAAGALMNAEAPPLLADLHTSLDRGRHAQDGGICYPVQLAWNRCPNPENMGTHAFQPIGDRTNFSYPTLDIFGFSYNWPIAMFSGALVNKTEVVEALLDWTATKAGAFMVPVARRKGQPAGVCSFVEMGQGYGLLLLDKVDEFQILMYALAAHGNTPGTWTAAECWTVAEFTSGYAAPSQVVLPTFLKWQLLFEDPFTNNIWIARAIPRSWLSDNGTAVAVHDGVTSRGRLSFTLEATGASTIKASIAPATSGRAFVWPMGGGGIKLRLRSPSFPAKKLASVTVGGKAWAAFDAAEETVTFDTSTAGMHDIVATLKTDDTDVSAMRPEIDLAAAALAEVPEPIRGALTTMFSHMTKMAGMQAGMQAEMVSM